MSVISETVGRPAPTATSTRLCARSRAPSSVAMKAPSRSSRPSPAPCRPAASFLDRIEAVISGIDSTVAVTSRIA